MQARLSRQRKQSTRTAKEKSPLEACRRGWRRFHRWKRTRRLDIPVRLTNFPDGQECPFYSDSPIFLTDRNVHPTMCAKRKKADRIIESVGLFQGARFLRHLLNTGARFSGEPSSLSDKRCVLRTALGLKDLTPSPVSLERNFKQCSCQMVSR